MRNFFKNFIICMLIGIATFGIINQAEAKPIHKDFSDKIILAEKIDYEDQMPIINTGAFFFNTTFEIIKHSGYIEKDWLYGALAVDINKTEGEEVVAKVKSLVISPTTNGMSVLIKNEYETKTVETEIFFSATPKDSDRTVIFSVNGQTIVEADKYNWRTVEQIHDYRYLAYKYYEDETQMSFIVLSAFCLLPLPEF